MADELPTTDQDVAALRARVAAAQAEVNRRRWAADPVLWARERMDTHLWSKQREIMRAVRDNRLVSAPTAHACGKSYLAAHLVCWWCDTHLPGHAAVVTTASTWSQIEVVLWKEIRRAHVKGNLRGRTNRTEWLMPIAGAEGKYGAEEVIAFGHRPQDMDPTAFQGVHAPAVLVVIDEACGLPKQLWASLDSLVSNEDSRLLAIGNPDDPLSEFAEVSKPGTDFVTIHISAFDSPNFTGEPCPEFILKQLVSQVWVEEKKRRWGETNPLYISKVLGQFPEYSHDGLIPMHWVRAAQERPWRAWPSPVDGIALPTHLGVDVGGGGDKNVICLRRGDTAEIVFENREPDTMKTCGQIIRYLRDCGASVAKVDYIGIGRGAVDRGRELKQPLLGIQVGDQAVNHEAYANLRAEGFWHLRELFQTGQIRIDPNDDELAAQLLDLRYLATSNGRILVESKESMKQRGKNSPDRADALMLAMFPDSAPPKDLHVTWGRRLRTVEPAATATEAVVEP